MSKSRKPSVPRDGWVPNPKLKLLHQVSEVLAGRGPAWTPGSRRVGPVHLQSCSVMVSFYPLSPNLRVRSAVAHPCSVAKHPCTASNHGCLASLLGCLMSLHPCLVSKHPCKAFKHGCLASLLGCLMPLHPCSVPKHPCKASKHGCFASLHGCFAPLHPCSGLKHPCKAFKHPSKTAKPGGWVGGHSGPSSRSCPCRGPSFFSAVEHKRVSPPIRPD